jgi:hypothetical protein
MRIRAALPGLGLIALLVGCSGIEVHTDWDREIDFTKYRSYRWAPTERTSADSAARDLRAPDRTLLDRRIRSAVDDEMAAKGYVRTDARDADLLLVYHSSSRRRVDVYDSPYRRRWGWGPGVHRWREGTLLLEVVDRRENFVVWQGWGTGALGSPEESEADVREIVEKILKRFPPEPE